MIQPFSPEHIKKYIFFYAGVVLFVVLFFIINTLNNPQKIELQDNTLFIEKMKQKNSGTFTQKNAPKKEATPEKKSFRLLDKAY